ncbi:MAG: hypothetical protein AB1489_43685 [Acidobacteriota bacterium]
MSNALTTEELLELPDKLNYEMEKICKQLKIARLDKVDELWKPTKWEWQFDVSKETNIEMLIIEQWKAKDVASLYGPGSLHIHVGQKSIIFGNWVRWGEFITDSNITEALRSITFYFASYFHSGSAIYLPDSGQWTPPAHAINSVYEGKSFDDIKSQIEEEAGTPARLIFLIDKAYYLDGYYIDTFHDLKIYQSSVEN